MKRIYSLMLTTILLAGCFNAVEAIPAFARKYSMSCITCHNPIPRLKDYGDNFAGAGFRLSDKEAPRYYQNTGDRLLSLVRDFALAVRIDGYFSYDHYNNSENDLTDFRSPFLMKLMSGGAISDHLSYYFYFYLYERGEVAGVEDAFLMYNDLFGVDFDIYLGQFQVCDPMFKRELRLTLEDYYIYTVTPGISDINLSYEKGLMLTYGTNFGTTLVTEVVNGNGIGEADERWRFDKDKYKDFLGRVSQDIGKYLRAGAFVYAGKEALLPGDEQPSTNEALLWGPDLSVSYNEILQLNLQYLHRTDSRVINDGGAGAQQFEDVTTQGGFGELIFMPQGDRSRWYLVGLYNWADSDLDTYDFESATFHAGYIMRRNVRLISEFTYRFETNESDKFWRTSLGFVAAF